MKWLNSNSLFMIPKFYFTKEKSPLKNFSDDIIDEIIEKYSSKVTISSFIKNYEGLNRSNLYSDLPYKISDTKCEICNNLMYHKVGGKGGATPKKWFCSSCNHTNSYRCNCSICIEKKQQLIKESKEICYNDWNKLYENKYTRFQYKIDDLNIYDQIYLKMILEKFISTDRKSLNYNNFEYGYDRLDGSETKGELYSKAIEFIERKILIPTKNQNFDIFLPNKLSSFLPLLDFLNINWEVNIENPYENEKTIIENLFIYFELKVYTELEKTTLLKEIYEKLIKSYILRLSAINLDSIIREYSIDLLVDELFKNVSLSKAFYIIYKSIFKVKSTVSRFNYSDEIKINNEFTNCIIDLINQFNKNEIILKDYNKPREISISIFDEYVIENIFMQRDSYFYLSKNQIL